jgi:hypothetical protein
MNTRPARIMIATPYLNQYPVVAIDYDIVRNLTAICDTEKDNRALRTVSMLNAFLDITNQSLSRRSIRKPEDIDELLYGFEGFLNSHTDYPERTIGSLYNMLRRMLREVFGFEKDNVRTGDKSAWKVRQDHSKKYFTKMQKSTTRLRYYEGWFGISRDEQKVFIDLSRFHNQYGEKLTNYYLEQINNHCSKYSATSVKQQIKLMRPTTNLICKLYNNKRNLTSLQSSIKVNEFAELLFAERKANCILNGNKLKFFYIEWTTTVSILKNTIVGTAIMAEPLYPLFCPTYEVARDTNAQESLYEKALTHVPLTITDEAAFVQFRRAIDGDISIVSDCCVKTCQQEMEKLTRRALMGEKGHVIHDFKNKELDVHFSTNDVLATWNEYTYRINETGIFKCIPPNELIDIIKPLGAFTLFPYMILMVEQHAFITPTWFTDFELYNKKGQLTGFTQSGDKYIATSFKPRSKPKARQSVICNDISAQLMKDIIALTSEARAYLRSIGDPNWRYLLLSGGLGFTSPSRITNLTKYTTRTIKTIPLYINLRSNDYIAEEKRESLCGSLSLRAMRASRVIQIYLETLSQDAVVRELRHSEHSRALMNDYLPAAVREFVMERWIRLFQNAIIYEAMKDSPYLLESLDFNTQEELDEFLLNHKPHYRIRPEVEKCFSDCYLSDKDGEIPGTYDRAYIALNKQKLIVLLSLYLVISEALNSKSKITSGAMRWYPIAQLLTQAANLQKEGNLTDICSHSVRELLKHTAPDIVLAKKMESLVYE